MDDQEYTQKMYGNLHQWILLKIAIAMCYGFSIREDEEFGTVRIKIFDYLSYRFIQAEKYLIEYALELAKLFPPFSVVDLIEQYEEKLFRLYNSFRYGDSTTSIENVKSSNLLDIDFTPEEDAIIKAYFLECLSYDFLLDGMDYSPFRYSANLTFLVDEKTLKEIKRFDKELLKRTRQELNAQLQPQLDKISILPERVLQSANVPDWIDLEDSGMDDRELKRRLSGRFVNPIHFEDVGIKPRHRRRSSIDYDYKTVNEPSLRRY